MAASAMTRAELLDAILERILAIERTHPVRVAIDGADAAGKTTLADELAVQTARRGRAVIRAGIDAFHHLRHIRYRRGPESAEGYFRGSFNLAGLRAALLEPPGPGGSRLYRSAIFDHRADTAVDSSLHRADPGAVLLFDGVFLMQPALRPSWDLTIFLTVAPTVTLARALGRDAELLGTRAEVMRGYRTRYMPGQEIYFSECRPQEAADLLIDNNDPANPSILTAGGKPPAPRST
jgi:uridine kinase